MSPYGPYATLLRQHTDVLDLVFIVCCWLLQTAGQVSLGGSHEAIANLLKVATPSLARMLDRNTLTLS